MEVRFWAATDVGRTRDHNEDNFLVDKKLNLFVVADGMGGHAAGEVASSMAVREVRRVIAEHRDVVENYVRDDSPAGRQAIVRLIESAIEQACARIFHLAQENADKRGMGTTLSLLLVANKRGFIGHVGDSRVYLVRSGQVHQLTEDHSLINELIKRGRLKPGDAFDSPYKNAVTRAVGVYESVEVDTFEFDVLPGDNYLLCSDGLSCYLDDDVTRSYLTAENVKEIPEQLIRLANDSGGKDNITAVVVRAVAAKEDEQRKRVSEVRQKLDTLRVLPLFKYLGYRDLVKVMNLTVPKRFAANELIFDENTRGETFYVILEGLVRITKKDIHLADLGPGGHFGEMAMVDQAPRSATAQAIEPIKALAIERSQFYELMRSDPSLSVKLMWSFIQVLNTRLRMTNSELLNARETIDILSENQMPGVIAELPNVDPGLQAIAALPVMVTDELLPNFLFDDSEHTGTDPMLRADAGGDDEGYDDIDPAASTVELVRGEEDRFDDRITQPESIVDPSALDDPESLVKTTFDQPAFRIERRGEGGDPAASGEEA
jgi:serine/threonine protein phosphatase PrpC/CRP-like cAMP-binding protein